MLNGLSLFSGIGGLDVALSGYVRPIAYCEIDPYCQAVLFSRMADESIPIGPIWDDVGTLVGNVLDGTIDIIYGGFPCQDISVAGRGAGLAGKRSGLFFEIKRLADEIRPNFIYLENVPAITSRGGTRVVTEIASLGYDCRWLVISAASVGALHKRERWFLLAHANGKGLEGANGKKQKITESSGYVFKEIDTNARCEYEGGEKKPERPPTHIARSCGFWETEPAVGRVVDGVPMRVDRIKSLGNAVVPQQAKEAFEILMGYK